MLYETERWHADGTFHAKSNALDKSSMSQMSDTVCLGIQIPWKFFYPSHTEFNE